MKAMRHGLQIEEEKSKTSFDDPRSSVGRNSSRQELKFIASTRAMRTYQKEEISPKIQRRRFGEIKFLILGGALGLPNFTTVLQEARVLPTLVYFQP